MKNIHLPHGSNYRSSHSVARKKTYLKKPPMLQFNWSQYMLISHDVNYQNIEHLEQTAEDKTLPTIK